MSNGGRELKAHSNKAMLFEEVLFFMIRSIAIIYTHGALLYLYVFPPIHMLCTS